MIDAHIRKIASQVAGQLAQPQFGIVSAVDPVAHACKVTLQPDGVETGWIPDAALACGSLRVSSPCEVGTQVKCTPTEGDAEHPVIVARVFDATMTPAMSPLTGKPAQPGEMLIAAGQAGTPETNAAAAQHPAWVHIQPSAITMGAGNAQWSIANGMVMLTIGSTSFAFSALGLIVTSGDVTVQGISSLHHEHTGVQSGSSNTGMPL